MANENWYRHLRREGDRVIRQFTFLRKVPRLEDLEPEIDLDAIAWELYQVNVIPTADKLDDDVSGLADLKNNLIWINTRNRSKGHQRYTEAHEIGHFHFHKNSGLSQIHRLTRADVKAVIELSGRINLSKLDYWRVLELKVKDKERWEQKRREIEAGVFASALLMPTPLMLFWAPRLNRDSVPLADKFGVSREAMEWRLKSLFEDHSEITGQGKLALFDPE